MELVFLQDLTHLARALPNRQSGKACGTHTGPLSRGAKAPLTVNLRREITLGSQVPHPTRKHSGRGHGSTDPEPKQSELRFRGLGWSPPLAWGFVLSMFCPLSRAPGNVVHAEHAHTAHDTPHTRDAWCSPESVFYLYAMLLKWRRLLRTDSTDSCFVSMLMFFPYPTMSKLCQQN